MDQARNRLRVSLVSLVYRILSYRISCIYCNSCISSISCGVESHKSFKVGLHPPHNFPWTHIVTENLAQSSFLLEQFHILGNTVVRDLANFGGNGCE